MSWDSLGFLAALDCQSNVLFTQEAPNSLMLVSVYTIVLTPSLPPKVVISGSNVMDAGRM